MAQEMAEQYVVNSQTEMAEQYVVNSQTEIDIEALVKELEVNTGRGHSRPECLISRVNKQTRLVDPSAYDPYSVHIGPYHHDPWHRTEPVKREILRHLLPDNEKERAAKLRQWLTEIAGLEEHARGYYADSAQMMEFAQMLLLDGCYVLHWLGVGDRNGASGASAGGSPTSRQRRRALDYIAIVRDVVYLLENQIPFFVLEKIHELIHGKSDGGSAVVELIHGKSDGGSAVVDAVMKEIRWLLGEQGYSTLVVAASAPPCHLVHLLHMHFRPTPPISGGQIRKFSCILSVYLQCVRFFLGQSQHTAPITNVNSGGTNATGGNLRHPKTGGAAVHRWRLATQYEIAGVKFERRRLDPSGPARSVLDVEIKDRTLRVPSLTVDNNTWRILRNLMALEQHSPRLGSHVTAYCLFLSQIAGTKKDVELLAKKEIIVPRLGSDKDVAEGFTNLCRDVAIDLQNPDHNYLSETMEKLERRYRSRWYNWMAWLQRNHLSNPWLVIALLAAIIGFACQVIQTVYLILGSKSGK